MAAAGLSSLSGKGGKGGSYGKGEQPSAAPSCKVRKEEIFWGLRWLNLCISLSKWMYHDLCICQSIYASLYPFILYTFARFLWQLRMSRSSFGDGLKDMRTNKGNRIWRHMGHGVVNVLICLCPSRSFR